MVPRGRRGFTLVELITVISIIGILIAVMIPAVQRVREAANRSLCGNNLKQISTAIHHYHDLYLVLPPSRLDASGGVTWAVLILPYLDQQPFYDQWNVTKWYYAHSSEVRQTRVKTYFCPARRTADSDAVSNQGEIPEVGPWKAHIPPYTPPFFGALGDYAVCAGDNSPGNEFYGPNANGSHVIANFVYENNTLPHVIKNATSRTRFATLTDGLSNTFLAGEKHVPFGKFGREIDGDGSIYNGDPLNMNASRVAGGEYTIARSPDEPFKINFGSYHIGVCQFVLADGSVRAIPATISGAALKVLAVCNDGRLTLPEY